MKKFIGNVPENNHPYQNDVKKQSYIKLKSIDKAQKLGKICMKYCKDMGLNYKEERNGVTPDWLSMICT